MASKLFSWLLYFVFLAAVVLMGWREPLKYRFMTGEQIANSKGPVHAPTAVPPTAAPQWMNDNRRWDTVPHTFNTPRPYGR